MTVKRKTGRPAKVPGEKATKEKIFDAAVDLFADRGYDGVSIRDIAKAVGIKESSVYKHYASKDEILDDIFEYMKKRLYLDTVPDNYAAFVDSVPVETILANGLGELASFMRDPYMLKIMRIITIEMYHNERIRGFFREQMFVRPVDEMETLFRMLGERGKIKDYDPRALATAYFAFSVYMYFDTFMIRYGEPLDFEGVERKSRAQMKLFVEMLKPDNGQSG
jgi:AcrR family transcriptional regulator